MAEALFFRQALIFCDCMLYSMAPSNTASRKSLEEHAIAASKGNAESLALLDAEAYRNSYRLGLRTLRNSTEAEDFASEIRQVVLRNLHHFVEDQRENTSFKAWAYKIAVNALINRFRRKRTVIPFSQLSDEQRAALENRGNPDYLQKSNVDPERKAISREESTVLREAIERLRNEGQRNLLHAMLDNPELTQEELAEKLGIPHGTLKSRFFRARLKLLGDGELYRISQE